MDHASETEGSVSNSIKGARDSAHAKNTRLGVHATIPPSKNAWSVVIPEPPWQHARRFNAAVLEPSANCLSKVWMLPKKKGGEFLGNWEGTAQPR